MISILAERRISAAEDQISRMVPFSVSLTDTVASTKAGDLISSWLIDGLSFEGMGMAQAEQQMAQLNLLVRSLSNGKFAFWVHRIRRSIGDKLHIPETGFAHDFLKKYNAGLTAGGLMGTQIYLSILYRPHVQSTRSSLFPGPALSQGDWEGELEAAMDVMTNLQIQVRSTLAEYRPHLLGTVTKAGVVYSDQLTLYAFLINGVWTDIPRKNVPLDRYLPTSRLFFGNEFVESRDIYGSIYSTFIDIKDYADMTYPGILNPILGLPCEYVETHSFSPMTGLDAQSALKTQRNQLLSSDDNARSQIVEIDFAIDNVISGKFSLGEYHYSMQVKGASIEAVKVARSHAVDALQQKGFLAVPLDLITQHAFAAQLPGNWRSRPRVANLSSLNFCGLCSLHNFTVGKRNGNPWGEAVAIFKSPAGQPVYFNFHDSKIDHDSFDDKELGNTQIIGESGTGKTALSLFLLFNLEKFKTQIIFFDKDRGAEIAIRAIGGKYLALENAKPTGFAPFKMDPTPQTIAFWGDLVTFCSMDPARPHTATEEKHIRDAVLMVARQPRAHRNFQAVLQSLMDVTDNSVAQRLRKWAADPSDPGALAWALDCADDELQFENARPYGFDYTDVLEDQRTCPAIMMYLMYRVESLIDGRRFAFFMDEYWKALSVPYFEEFAKNKQKTIRKQNGFGVYMTQSTSDCLRSPIARTLIEQTATFIFLPNSKADRDEYVNGFKLSDDEFAVVKSLVKGSYMFAIKQGTKFTLARLDLARFHSELKVLSGDTANVARLDRLRARLGNAPENWLAAFINNES
ncbi:VirB4 family type IV secretion/conjugal transfer ATPase [Variovorax sp. LG9.2]|uniref:VirB4 family type IV secretion/conjugal transfer ATPase n=1 Tax=Variovorax sp. LG9.2 TaxID=3048626 RepID=UPI002B23B8B3|nr:VirB4 family type IV secretion/conjugal transfer ATPase [Variovorax sp. LG9.2]MEB0059310.1 VirB4 family type IV secretion/conjugal transfer ATPase [Variovorax sp. LG9.2]